MDVLAPREEGETVGIAPATHGVVVIAPDASSK
jgi:hypothetical protein